MSEPTGAGDAADRLFELLPLIHRMRDEAAGNPLRDLLRVIAEQVQVVQDDIARTYDNWFVETAEDWAVPYLADLIGWSPLPDAGWVSGGIVGRDLARRALPAPRRDVANTLGHRRRKGTRALLEDLALDVAGLPGRAVEFYRLLARFQHVNHLQLDRGRTADLRHGDRLDLLGGPFDRTAHTVDVRRATSRRTTGRYGIASVGLFVQKLRAYPVTGAEAYQVERVGAWAFTFDALGFDVQLYGPGMDGDLGDSGERVRGEQRLHPEQPGDLPGPISRRGFIGPDGRTAAPLHYGEGRSLVIHAPGWPAPGQGDPVPPEQVVPADLSDWEAYRPLPGTVAVDPVLGRMVFPRLAPPQQVRVSYHHGFGVDLGGGEYPRPLPEPPRADTHRFHAEDLADPDALLAAVQGGTGAEIAVIRRHWPGDGAVPEPVAALNAALADPDLYALAQPGLPVPAGTPMLAAGRRHLESRWPSWIKPARWYRRVTGAVDLRTALHDLEQEQPRYAVIEVAVSTLLELTAELGLRPDQHLLVRAAERTRPVLCPADRQAGRPACFSVTLPPGSRLTLDGLVMAGPVHLSGDSRPEAGGDGRKAARVVIRHCTLVPGWAPRSGRDTGRPTPPAVELAALPGGDVEISHSIVGPVQIEAGPPGGEPLRLTVSDSILDATQLDREAVGTGGHGTAQLVLDIARTTVLGTVQVHAIDRGENTIFAGPVTAARRSWGCLRFCWVPTGSHTPRRLHCQPDTALAPLGAPPSPELAAETEQRVRPRFVSVRYPDPAYAQLAPDCPDEIRTGADDGSELGAFHDLYLPQRLSALHARLTEYVPAGMDAGLLPMN